MGSNNSATKWWVQLDELHLPKIGSWGFPGFHTCIGAEPAEGGQHRGGAHQEG